MASKRLRTFLGTFVTLSVLVAAGVAGARGVLFTASVVDDAMEEVVEELDPCEEPAEDGDGEPAEDGDGESDLAQVDEGGPAEDDPEGEPEGDPEECEPEEDPEGEPQESKDEEEEEDGDEEARVVAQGDRDAACDEAAGIADDPLPEGEQLTGLDNALSHVLENCKKNSDAPGLLVALERLAKNRGAKETGKPDGAGRPDHAGPPEGAGRPDHAGPPEGAGPPSGGNGGPPSHAGGGNG